MNSGFVTISPQNVALSDSATKKNVISTENHKVRLVGRNPSSGIPAQGLAFSIDVEVQTNINQNGVLFRVPFWCPDATIVIRGAYNDSGKIWGHKFITTRYTNSCTGRENIQFLQDFVPDDDHWVVIEVYEGSLSLEEVKNQAPAGKSNPMHFGIGLKAGRESGLYDKAHTSAIDAIANNAPNGLDDIQGLLTKGLLVAGVGLGVYFTAPFFPVIKNQFSKLAKKSSNE